MSDHLRQTGRTTRMLERALRLARDGRAVYVLAVDRQHIAWLKGRLAELEGAAEVRESIKFETDATLGPSGPDWSRMLPSISAHPNCILLADHYYIESRWSALVGAARRAASIRPAAG